MDVFSIQVSFVALILCVLAALAAGYAFGFFLRKMFSEFQIRGAKEQAEKILEDAGKEAENRLKTAAIEARETRISAKAAIEKELKEKRDELREQELAARKKEDEVRNIFDKNIRLERELEQKAREISSQEKDLAGEKLKYRTLIDEEMKKLEVVASFTAEQAKEEIRNKVVDEAKKDAAKEVRKIGEHAKGHAEEEARKLITMAVQRLASDHVAESSVSVVELPNDEIKGRIIGREGRNIRTPEQCTGIDLIIDDTPGASLAMSRAKSQAATVAGGRSVRSRAIST